MTTDRQRPWAALALLLTSLLCYSLCVILARVVYLHGGNALTALLSRMGLFFVAMALYFRLTRQSAYLAPTERYASLALGVLVSIQSYAYYSAFQYIPISLAALIFYTYPTLVTLISRLIARTPLTPLMLASLLAAFLGLALVLEVSIGTVAPHGLVRASFAAIGMVATVLLASRILARVDNRRMTLHSSGMTTALYVTAALLTGAAIPPSDGIGWAALLAIPAIYSVAVLGWYTSMRTLGVVKVSFISNSEPMFTVFLAAVLLGESLTPRQLLGAALIIGAIFAVQVFGRR
ncbi:MAG: DMT family transporter [Alphaproteobacteria bacterium]